MSLAMSSSTPLTCSTSAGRPHETGIFDPAFREQFEITRPSPHYQALLAAVPVAFVGSEERLTSTVRLVCKELQTEFADKGITLPPWRDVQAMLTKWRPSSATPTPRVSTDSAPEPRHAGQQPFAAPLLQHVPAAAKRDFLHGAAPALPSWFCQCCCSPPSTVCKLRWLALGWAAAAGAAEPTCAAAASVPLAAFHCFTPAKLVLLGCP